MLPPPISSISLPETNAKDNGSCCEWEGADLSLAFSNRISNLLRDHLAKIKRALYCIQLIWSLITGLSQRESEVVEASNRDQSGVPCGWGRGER